MHGPMTIKKRGIMFALQSNSYTFPFN